MEAEQVNNTAYIALGSNLGVREQYLQEALRKLNQHPFIQVVRHSNVYETEPVGYEEQGAFLNMAAKLSTRLHPQILLEELLQVEASLGRVREIRNGPRTIDLDLLLYDDTTIHTESLTLPHPRMHERAFVLVPLMEIVEDSFPGFSRLAEWTASLNGKEGVQLWKQTNWLLESGRFAN
ncbi:2-amino-4-hydroxy-6-hydroxymethyldihydropteridine diphosphokinase [Paenibacillus sp. J2TS4]|uniref:2-amino-4-hydroxy-6- hydroxymethyldihydropteridine diphosphokinase n=1 Tax=Paenibacillus sp. J2TS4 TaxID=2807194 RepID=UPI001B17A876|nr:2-amino-4-hydroxy-6-hydroxymethyldihydropteridine diphosphokinase [Paenibacillus sp. J2TS4]GIP36366.1 2-amino-4-hydroxy-6-hydroxymethyldihydropteridine diphosphokinase [Paenibacillus sp. J2TS4]